MSTNSSNWLPLVAARDGSGTVWGRFDHERPRFGNAEWSIIVGATSLLVIVMLVSYLRSRRRNMEFLSNSASKLFGELSAAHRLTRSNRRLIKRLAAANGQKNAAVMFVEPSYFDPENLARDEKVSPDRLRQLRHELFE